MTSSFSRAQSIFHSSIFAHSASRYRQGLYIGVGSAACAAVLHERRAAGADTVAEYLQVVRERVKRALEGGLRRRPLGRPIYQPSPNDRIAQRPEGLSRVSSVQPHLFATARGL